MNPKAISRVVVTGATGNVGTSLVRVLADEPRVGSVLGLARRRPGLDLPGVEWAEVDLSREGDEPLLARHVADADAVVHLAWRFQPTHDPVETWRSNVLGSVRVFDAVAAARVPVLVHASSVGAYSPARRAARRCPRRGRRTAGRAPRTPGRRRIWNGSSTPSSGTIPRPGWSGCVRPSS